MSIGAAGAGAAEGLKQVLARRFLAQQEAARVAQEQIQNQQRGQQMAMQQQRDASDEAYRTGQTERQTRMDTAAGARQAQQDEIAATERRQEGNDRGVMQMMGQGLQQIDGATKPNRTQIMGMLSEIGKPPVAEMLKDPEADRAEYEAREGIQHRNRMQEIGAQGAESRRTNAERPSATKDLSALQQQELEAMMTVNDIGDKAIALGDKIGWKGVGGLGKGTLSAMGARELGTGTPEEQELRNYIGNITATIARLRGGTSFTPNEQQLLNQYTPRINEHPNVIKSKIASLKTMVAMKARNAQRVARGDLDASTEVAPVSSHGAATGSTVQKWGRDANGKPVRVP